MDKVYLFRLGDIWQTFSEKNEINLSLKKTVFVANYKIKAFKEN